MSFKVKDGNDKKAASFSGLSKKVKIAATMNRGKVPKSCRATTMDLAKAMGILGFTSSRWLDMSSGLTPKQELDKAHFGKMMQILKTKKKNSTSDELGNKEKVEKKVEEAKTVPNPYRRKKEKTADDEIRILHEAYQFLLKRYNLGVDPKEEAEEKNLVSPFMKLELDDEPKKVEIELDLDEDENEDKEEEEDEEEGDDSCFGDDVFNSLAAQIQAAALDGGAPVSKTRPSAGEGDGEAASDNEDTATKKGKSRGKSLKASGPDRTKSADRRDRRTGSLKVTSTPRK